MWATEAPARYAWWTVSAISSGCVGNSGLPALDAMGPVGATVITALTGTQSPVVPGARARLTGSFSAWVYGVALFSWIQRFSATDSNGGGICPCSDHRSKGASVIVNSQS